MMASRGGFRDFKMSHRNILFIKNLFSKFNGRVERKETANHYMLSRYRVFLPNTDKGRASKNSLSLTLTLRNSTYKGRFVLTKHFKVQ